MDQGHSRLYPFDPDSGQLPEIAAPGVLLSSAGGGVVTLIVAPDVIQSAWSPAAAAAIAQAWSDQGHRVVLFDLSLTAPVLHVTLGLPNAVGIVDLVLREASMPSVAQQAGATGFQFVAVGSPVEDPTEVTLTDAWSTFVEEVGHAQATVLFYVPADLPGVEALVASSAATLLLAGDPTEADWVAQSFALDDVSGLVEDRGESVPAIGASPEDPAGSAVDELAFLSAPGVEGDGGATEATSPVPTSVPEVRTRSETPMHPEPEPRSEPKRKLVQWRPVLVGTLVGLAALIMWQALFAPSQSPPPPEPAGARQTPAVSEPSPPEPRQAYSLALAAYQARETAEARARRLSQQRPDLLFIVAPVRVNDRVYHRVLAGPAADSLGAEAVRASLAETLAGDDGARWIVRPTPLAFDFGEFESAEAADGRVAEIGNGGIGAYVLEVAGSPSPAFRVYAGAYQTPAEAEVMRAELDSALGAVPTLGPRIGRYAH